MKQHYRKNGAFKTAKDASYDANVTNVTNIAAECSVGLGMLTGMARRSEFTNARTDAELMKNEAGYMLGAGVLFAGGYLFAWLTRDNDHVAEFNEFLQNSLELEDEEEE